MKKTRVKAGKGNPRRAIRQRSEITFIGSMSNMAGGFDLFELGSVRTIQRNIKREDFTKTYCEDISAIFHLTNAQQLLLKAMLANKAYFEPFAWHDFAKTHLSEKTGISVVHVDHCFRSLCAVKKIITKVRTGVYKLNADFVFHPKEVGNADFLGVNIRYVFDQESNAEIALRKDKNDITLEDINTLIEIYNRKQKREGQIKGMLEE